MPPLPAVSLRAGICSCSQIPNVHLQVDTALEFPAAAVPHRIPMALPRQTLGSLETPGAIPIPRTSSRQQPPHQNLLSTGQGSAAQWLWDIAAGTRTCWGRVKRKEIQACLCRKHIFPASGLVPEQVLECRAACQAQTPAWEAEKVHGTREVSNQTFLAQGSRAVPTEPFQTSSSAKQVCSVNFADAEAGQSY